MGKSGVDLVAAVSGARRDAKRERETRRTRKRRADALSQVPLFAELSRRDLTRLADAAQIVSFRPGAPVIQEGDLGATLFVIVEGAARVTRGGRKLASLAPGDFFGEVSLLDGGPRTASVVAETPLVLVRLFRGPFYRLVEADPAIGVKVLTELAKRLRRIERRTRG